MTPTLAIANQHRMTRAAKLRQIRNGEIDPVGAILTANEGMTVIELLCAIPRHGKYMAQKRIEKLRICEDRIFGEPTPTQKLHGKRPITRRQRVILADEIEDFMQRTGRRAA